MEDKRGRKRSHQLQSEDSPQDQDQIRLKKFSQWFLIVLQFFSSRMIRPLGYNFMSSEAIKIRSKIVNHMI